MFRPQQLNEQSPIKKQRVLLQPLMSQAAMEKPAAAQDYMPAQEFYEHGQNNQIWQAKPDYINLLSEKFNNDLGYDCDDSADDAHQ